MTLRLEEQRTHLRPGPLPTVGPIGSLTDQSKVGTEPKNANLESLLGRLEKWFALVLAVSVPFIAYVLSWKGGFDLTYVTYPVLLTAMALASAVCYTSSEWAHRVRSVSTSRWLPIQSLPIAGFVLWRFGTAGLYRLIPLAAVTWVFVGIINPLRTPASR
jgi:hypothetical protein